jgi:iron complex transport system permease protein
MLSGRSRIAFLPILVLASLVAMLAALTSGSIPTTIPQVLAALNGSGDPAIGELVNSLRLPRAIAAYGTGAGLALAGVFMQVLLRNPLADPYILGTSGGAAAGALVAMAAGAGVLALQGAAFLGALASTLLVFAVAGGRGTWSAGRLLLTGVVLAAGWNAVVSLMLALGSDTSLRGMLYWLMGDFTYANDPLPVLGAAMLILVAGLFMAKSLNVLATGDYQAQLLGLEVRRTRIVVYTLSSLMTAVAVTTAGTVGFVGLVTPHLVRQVVGADHRFVVPASALAGGILLVAADTLARTVMAPRQLPVGAITALVGVPLFLLLLTRGNAVANSRSGI